MRSDDRAPSSIPEEECNQPPAVSVVVPTRNRCDSLRVLLEALEEQDDPAYEVIVVDDASTDATPEFLRRWSGPDRIVETLGHNRGSYVARNRGWREARGQIIAFTDDDCRPAPDWLSCLRAHFDPSVVAVQGAVHAGPGRATPFTHQIDQRRGGPPYRTCNMAYRKSALLQLDGFDERLRWYSDNLLGLQARRLGKIVFASDAVVRHPPREREWRSRADWLLRFEADALYRRELQRLGSEPKLVPSGALPVLLWMVRPLIKQSDSHLAYAVRHPSLYRAQIVPLMHEKWEMIQALRDYWKVPIRHDEAGDTHEGQPLPRLPDQPSVSVVIVTRDRPFLLEQMLDSLRSQTLHPLETVVVDHGEGSGIQEIVKRHGALSVIGRGGTLAEARQQGIEACRGEIVAFTDDDCRPDGRWLERLVTTFREDGRLWGVQGRTVAEQGPLRTRAISISSPNPLYQTCNMAYRRAALERAGGFDVRFQGWFEDTALAARVLEHGPIGFSSDAVVVHRAVTRQPLGREDWKTLLTDEMRLAHEYRDFYQRTRAPTFLIAILGRWVIGSALKTLVREAPRARHDPRGYAKLVLLLLRERASLLRVLPAFLATNRLSDDQPTTAQARQRPTSRTVRKRSG